MSLVPTFVPDPTAVPDGYVVETDTGDRIHFLDWGGPAEAAEIDGAPPSGPPGVVLVHGLSSTAWSWTAVARRLPLRRRTIAMDLRGHGLSDAPGVGYEPDTLADDVVAVAQGSGLLGDADRIVLAGHGFGAIVACWAAASLGERCAGLVLVDGGWQDVAATEEMEPDEFVRGIEEPPEVLRSMRAWLEDRRTFDPATWDADQEAAARAAVVETRAGRVVPVTRPDVVARMVEAMFAYRPAIVLPSVEAPIVALLATDDETGASTRALAEAQAALAAAGRPPIAVEDHRDAGHNLPRYRPDAVTAAILAVSNSASA